MSKKILSALLMAGLLTSIGAVSTAGASDDADSCISYTTTVVSDGSATASSGATTVLAVYPAWTASIPGASWLWNTPATASVTFSNGFTVPGATVLSATLDVAADNYYDAKVNGVTVGSELVNDTNFTLVTQDVYTSSVLAQLTSGANTLAVVGTNKNGVPAELNPAGVMYKLVVMSETCFGDVTVTNNSSALVSNEVVSGANTGGNTAGGSTGGNGGNGGSIKNGGGNQNVNYAGTGHGGRGGDAGVGGDVETGAATANASVDNDINYASTTVDLCHCDGTGAGSGDVTVTNDSGAEVGNLVGAGADTGNNSADGSHGGHGGKGGKIANKGGNQNVNGSAQAPTTTGNGGDGGNAGVGNGEAGGGSGFVKTGKATSDAKAVNRINHNYTRIVR